MKVGVNGAVRDISDLKVGVSGAVRAVSEAYIGVNGAVKKVWPTYSIVKTEHIDKNLNRYSTKSARLLYTITDTTWEWYYYGGFFDAYQLRDGPIYIYVLSGYYTSEEDLYLNGNKLSIKGATVTTLNDGVGWDSANGAINIGVQGNIAAFVGISSINSNLFDVVYRFSLSGEGASEGNKTYIGLIGTGNTTSFLFESNSDSNTRVICDKYIVQS